MLFLFTLSATVVEGLDETLPSRDNPHPAETQDRYIYLLALVDENTQAVNKVPTPLSRTLTLTASVRIAIFSAEM